MLEEPADVRAGWTTGEISTYMSTPAGGAAASATEGPYVPVAAAVVRASNW